jgi:hypothetical protein
VVFMGFYIVEPGLRGTGPGMGRSFETARIYRGPAPELPLDRIIGITSLELG